MNWQFWNKNGRATPIPETRTLAFSKIEWPTDIYDSARFLFGMYIERVSPFSSWQDSNATLSSGAQNIASLCVQSYQLSIWFWMIGNKFNTIVEKMARDAFLETALELEAQSESVSDFKFSDMLHWLLQMHQDAYESYANTPDDKKISVINGKTCELPREFFVALHFLYGMSESPYYRSDAIDLQNDDWALSNCLRYASGTATEVFVPMQAALINFNPDKFLKWRWNEKPGAFEIHLIRRYKNPLFRPERQVVTARDVYEARVRDANAWDAACAEATDIENKLFESESLPKEWFTFLNGLRERLDTLSNNHVRCIGRNSAPLEEYIARTRATVMKIWRNQLAGNVEALATLDQASELEKQEAAIFLTEWSRHIGHSGQFIPFDEVVPSLLTEDIESLTAIIKIIESQPKSQPSLLPVLLNARTGALDIVRPLLASGHLIPGIVEKLNILGVAL